MDFQRFLNDPIESSWQIEKAIFPGAEKNGWVWLFNYHAKKKYIHNIAFMEGKKPNHRTINSISMHYDNKT